MRPARIATFCIDISLATNGTVQSTTIYVPDSSPTIQGAINSATNGDTVIVRAGTYPENINFMGRAIRVLSEQGPNLTTIDGGTPSDPDSGSVVTFASGEDSTSVLEGFTLMDGNGNRDHTFRYGGGIYCELSSPTVVGNTIPSITFNRIHPVSTREIRRSSMLVSLPAWDPRTATWEHTGVRETAAGRRSHTSLPSIRQDPLRYPREIPSTFIR